MTQNQSTMLRWPGWLRQAVVSAAQENDRSMNSEILARLKASFAQGEDPRHGDLLPCPCGAGRPDATCIFSVPDGLHQIGCPTCGRSVSDLAEAGAIIKWTALVRSRRGVEA